MTRLSKLRYSFLSQQLRSIYYFLRGNFGFREWFHWIWIKFLYNFRRNYLQNFYMNRNCLQTEIASRALV